AARNDFLAGRRDCENLVRALSGETSPVGKFTGAVDVCICTFRRPAVADTIREVAAQHGIGNFPVRLIVADNAETPEAEHLVMSLAAELGLDCRYVHAPARNISIARNACLKEAQGDWIVFLDDDETPSPTWLKRLTEEIARDENDAVLGPVYAVYPQGT